MCFSVIIWGNWFILSLYLFLWIFVNSTIEEVLKRFIMWLVFFNNFLVINYWSQYESWPLREKAKLDILHHILTNTYQIETRSHARSTDCIGNALNEGNIQLCQRCVVMDWACPEHKKIIFSYFYLFVMGKQTVYPNTNICLHIEKLS